MIDIAMTEDLAGSVEDVLRDELAHGDVVLGTVGPVLGHLLANHDHSLFSDEIVSRVRGMASNLAGQLVAAQAHAAQSSGAQGLAERGQQALANALLADMPLVAHCHAKALEWQLTTRLEARNAIDPVLSPLLQALIASDDAATASAAMGALAAQARFVQHQRRMELPLSELPADSFHAVLTIWAGSVTEDDGSATAIARAIETLRADYDESVSRTGLLARLVEGMGAGAMAALSLTHGGVALFLSALSALSNQDRDLAIVSTNDRQLARLALSLRAAGLKPKAIEEQFLLIHPDTTLPEGFDTLRADRAAALLAASGRIAAY